MESRLIVGIAGGSGSGKTTLTERLRAAFPDSVTVIRHDDYYRSGAGLTMEQRAARNYDHPDAFETDLLIRHLEALRAGQTAESPVYDYTVHDRAPETKILLPRPVILVEGILIFADCRLRELMDIRIFVDTDADVRLARRILRDVKKRGRTVDSVVEQYFATVKPMHEQFVEPSRRFAAVIVPEGGKNAVALEMITDRIRRHLRESGVSGSPVSSSD